MMERIILQVVRWLVIPVATFYALSGWMVGHGVDATIASVLSGAAVFGYLSVNVKISVAIGA